MIAPLTDQQLEGILGEFTLIRAPTLEEAADITAESLRWRADDPNHQCADVSPCEKRYIARLLDALVGLSREAA
jgi:hypothetical protein